MSASCRWFATFCVSAVFGLTAHASEVRIPLNTTEDLVLTVPNDWQPRVRPTAPNQPYTLEMIGKTSEELMVLFTPVPSIVAQAPVQTDSSIKEFVLNTATRIKAQSVEQDIPITNLDMPNTFGYYFSVTARNPSPREWKYMTRGHLAIKEVIVVFTILTNEPASPLKDMALSAVKTVQRVKN
jgi:hypothetical protein